MSLLDPKWVYVNSAATDIRKTMAKHGFKATTDAERRKRQERVYGPEPKPENVTPLKTKALNLSSEKVLTKSFNLLE